MYTFVVALLGSITHTVLTQCAYVSMLCSEIPTVMQYNGAFAEGTWPPPEALETATPLPAEKTCTTAADPPTVASSSAVVAKLGVPNSNGSFWASQPAASQVVRMCHPQPQAILNIDGKFW